MFELPSIRRSVRHAVDGGQIVSDILEAWRDGNWQMLQCFAEDLQVADLVADTHAPAMTIFTIENEWAHVTAASPSGPSWFWILNPEGARHYDAPDAGPIEEVTAEAVGWAAEADLTPDPARIATAIGIRPGPFSEGVSEFLEALGLRFAHRQPIPDPAGGSPET
jgi:hypothetical protein